MPTVINERCKVIIREHAVETPRSRMSLNKTNDSRSVASRKRQGHVLLNSRFRNCLIIIRCAQRIAVLGDKHSCGSFLKPALHPLILACCCKVSGAGEWGPVNIASKQ